MSERFRRLINTTLEPLYYNSLIVERFHAPWEMSILSNVHRCWLAMPLVTGFLEMFAGVAYNREQNESLVYTSPPRTCKLLI